MRPYLEMFRARFLALLQYRAAAVAGLGTQVFWGLLRVMIFAAFYRSTQSAQPMTQDEVVTYIWLGQATLLLTIWRSDSEVEDMVRTGNVAYELLRPTDVYGMWFARSLASRTAPTLLRFVPMLALAFAFFGMRLPASPAAGVAWAASTLCAVLLSSAIGALILVSLLWTVSGRGLTILVTTGAWAFSGIVVPLPFFPGWMQPLIEFLPFRGLLDVPIHLYLGHTPAAEAPALLAHQLAWTTALVLLGRGLLARGTRRLVVHGG